MNKKSIAVGVLGWLALALTACQKEDAANTEDTTLDGTTIAVAVTESTTGISGGSTDSVYLLHGCGAKNKKAAVGLSTLPATVESYLNANYAGYTLHKALGFYDDAGAVEAYVVVIYYNDKPVGLKFDAAGNFVSVLEQREKGDLRGKGWHHGGRFANRGGAMKDTVALTAVPANILASFSSAYGTDTLVKAFRSSSNGYLLLSQNNGVIATSYTEAGVFEKRVALNNHKGKATAVAAAALPAAITSYLNTTYPGYVFNRAFSISNSTALRGYVVVIDANNTRYGVMFNADGSFVAVKTIH